MARGFDPARGEFAPYAATAVRNALRSLYDAQVRHHAHHAYYLDDSRAGGDSTAGRPVQNLADPHGQSVTKQARNGKNRSILRQAMDQLAPRSRLILERIAAGSSYSEIGAELGISKQAAHKIAHAGMQSLRETLQAMGYAALDTEGMLRSRPERT